MSHARTEAAHGAQERIVRKFVTEDAVRKRVPLWVGVNSPSGGGKTKSALRMAAGMKEVVGGEVHVLDTENDRALHYADEYEKAYGYRFKHTHFDPPFGSLDYLDACRHCIANGATVIIVDSFSHEHDGIGGLLEQHESEIDRMQEEQRVKGWDISGREQLSQSAWKLPKSNRRRMINELMQLKCLFILLFRAKEKLKFGGGGKSGKLGWMPVTGDDLIFEMTTSILLPPRSKGVPNWNPKEEGEKMVVKLGPFEELFKRATQLSEEIGAGMAKWALGGARPATPEQAVKGTDTERAAVIRKFGPVRQALGWDQAQVKKWVADTFGTDSMAALTIQQLEDAVSLLDVMASGGEEFYQAELASMIELGRVKVKAS